MAIGSILMRSLNGLLYSLWWVVLKCFDKFNPLKRRFHLDPQSNLDKTVSITPYKGSKRPYLVVPHVTKALTTVAIRHIDEQTNTRRARGVK